MALSAFDDRSSPPREEELAAMLATAYPHWASLKESLQGGDRPLAEEWGFTGRSTGWGLRLKEGGRIILYMTPCAGYFLVSFVLGEKAVKAARDAGLRASTLEAIDGARVYAEGRGVRFEVRKRGDLPDLRILARIKMAG